MENFDVIALNETWLDTENKHLLAEVAIHGYEVFHVDMEALHVVPYCSAAVMRI